MASDGSGQNPFGLSPDMAMNVLQGLDEQQIEGAITTAVDQFVVPQLQEIKQRAQNSESRKEAREVLEDMDPADQEEVFNETMSEIQVIAIELREEPMQGIHHLKELLRDPWTVEQLLLVFDEEPEVDPEYADHLKEFVSTQLRWIGVHLAPEMYTESEIRDVVDQVYPGLSDAEIRELLAERGFIEE